MRLINVRRGQFVYYKNKLHKVYWVNHFFKRSVHLLRLADFEQVIVTAKEIDFYKPQHMDSFICNHQRYTLDKNRKATVGDYILVINPRPDSLDRHYLNAIEIVSSIESNGVISNKSNGIKHNEYWVMTPGLMAGANKIDLKDFTEEDDASEINDEVGFLEQEHPVPKLGDIFQKNDSDPLLHTMVIAIKGETVYLGGGLTVSTIDLTNTDKWSFVINALEQ